MVAAKYEMHMRRTVIWKVTDVNSCCSNTPYPVVHRHSKSDNCFGEIPIKGEQKYSRALSSRLHSAKYNFLHSH